ncbi:cysteine hydrolase family protein [uncultured Tistrella sp.]|uniref:cysteine hydrolase family protein n=1 Tax=Tistrella mobilis TaxID=171437 RepID=UPI000C08F2F8|nr:cysteine hydrolase family protein [uncultured Tistrella sp.]MAM76456.1 cysteine hydrolase [Tistrella sp.]|tara:strand:+ start:30 stop:575 length:546 start_codon:yes stop_codon:yes gene_type:complete
MGKRALVVIDVQNDYFPGGRWPLVGIEAAAANVARLIAAFRAAGEPVVHVRHEFAGEGAPFFAAGSDGARIHDSVSPAEGEPVVLKHFPNAFRETGLDVLLREMGVDQVVIAGAMSHMCIDAGARAARDLGFEVTVAHDACATRDQEFGGVTVPAAQVHAAFMAALGFAYANVVATGELAG